MPSTLGRLGLMGKMVAPEGCASRLRRMVRPTLAGFSVAPISATERGLKMGSRGRCGRIGPVDSLTCCVAERGWAVMIELGYSSPAAAIVLKHDIRSGKTM